MEIWPAGQVIEELPETGHNIALLSGQVQSEPAGFILSAEQKEPFWLGTLEKFGCCWFTGITIVGLFCGIS